MSEPKSCITVVDYFGQKVEACCPHLLIREFSRKEGDNTADDRATLHGDYYLCLKTRVAVSATGGKGLDFLHSLCPLKTKCDVAQRQGDLRESLESTLQDSLMFATMQCDKCSRFMWGRVVDGKLATTCASCMKKAAK